MQHCMSLYTTRPFDWDEGDFLISLSLNLLWVNCNGFKSLTAQTSSGWIHTNNSFFCDTYDRQPYSACVRACVHASTFDARRGDKCESFVVTFNLWHYYIIHRSTSKTRNANFTKDIWWKCIILHTFCRTARQHSIDKNHSCITVTGQVFSSMRSLTLPEFELENDLITFRKCVCSHMLCANIDNVFHLFLRNCNLYS